MSCYGQKDHTRTLLSSHCVFIVDDQIDYYIASALKMCVVACTVSAIHWCGLPFGWTRPKWTHRPLLVIFNVQCVVHIYVQIQPQSASHTQLNPSSRNRLMFALVFICSFLASSSSSQWGAPCLISCGLAATHVGLVQIYNAVILSVAQSILCLTQVARRLILVSESHPRWNADRI